MLLNMSVLLCSAYKKVKLKNVFSSGKGRNKLWVPSGPRIQRILRSFTRDMNGTACTIYGSMFNAGLKKYGSVLYFPNIVLCFVEEQFYQCHKAAIQQRLTAVL
jgi:hypothetical protein